MYINFLRRRATAAISRWQHSVQNSKSVGADIRTLLVTVKHELAQTQIYPFYFYRNTLKDKYGVRFAELPLESLIPEMEAGRDMGGKNTRVTRIFFQPYLHMDPTQEAKVLQYLQTRFPVARIALMDWFAPLHIRYATAAAPFIDVYIKKQTYRDFSQYELPTVGDTNLNDYYARRHNIPDTPMQFVAPAGIESKIELGSNFGLSPQMVDLFLGAVPETSGRDIDLHARVAAKGVPWYQKMRQEAKDAVGRLQGLEIAAVGRVRRSEFFKELRRSKVCFSPFGYGEICWRDYEAFATGALLIKPDLGHLIVAPDIFIPDVTYVSLAWDLSDFAEKLDKYLKDEPARKRMTSEAFHRMQKWILSDECPASLARLC